MSQFTSQLTSLGWDLGYAEKFQRGAGPREVPARVLADFSADYLIHDGAIARRARARGVDPAVGDWVGVDDDTIKDIVPRRTEFSRRSPGAANRQQVKRRGGGSGTLRCLLHSQNHADWLL